MGITSRGTTWTVTGKSQATGARSGPRAGDGVWRGRLGSGRHGGGVEAAGARRGTGQSRRDRGPRRHAGRVPGQGPGSAALPGAPPPRRRCLATRRCDWFSAAGGQHFRDSGRDCPPALDTCGGRARSVPCPAAMSACFGGLGSGIGRSLGHVGGSGASFTDPSSNVTKDVRMRDPKRGKSHLTPRGRRWEPFRRP